MMGLGRPTKYLEKYCEELIDHMTEGHSFESFAGTIKVSFDTLYEWLKVHPEFSEAKKIGHGANLKTMETLALTDGMKCAKWIFTMKNRYPAMYRDRQEIQQSTTHTLDNDQVDLLADKLSEVLKLIDK